MQQNTDLQSLHNAEDDALKRLKSSNYGIIIIFKNIITGFVLVGQKINKK